MLKRLLMLTIPLWLATLSVGAEVHLQKFNGPTPSYSKPESFAPEGWNRIVDSFECWGDGPWYIRYQAKSSGGKDGAYLQAPRQRLSHPDDSEEYKDTYDLLVTPLLTGDISFWLKAVFSASYAYAEVYECSESNGEYSRGDLLRKIPVTEMSTEEWTEVKMHLDKPAYLGLRLSYVSIDEFSGEVPVPAASMAIEGATIVNEAPLPDPQGITTVAYDVNIANTGNTTINPGDEGYSLSIEQYYLDRVTVATQPIEVALEPGAKTTVRVSASVEASDKKADYRFDIVENIGKTRFDGKWVTILPYKPELNLRLDGASGQNITGPVSFGFTTDTPVRRTIALQSVGGAPVEVTAITAPAGYTVEGAQTPFTVAPGESKDITIALGTDIKGACGGDLVISATGMDNVTCALTGGVLGADSYFVDFEQGIPAEMLQIDPNNYEMLWEAFAVPDVYTDAAGLGTKAAHCSGMAMLVTPRLRMAEGERIVFNAAQESYSSVLNVYWSSDRIEWHPVFDIGGRDEYGDSPREHDAYFSNKHVDKSYSENYEFGQFSAGGFPAGDIYIAFEAGRARLDNVLAGRLSPTAVDIIVEGHRHPDRATVNNPCQARIIVRNLSSKPLAAADYTVTLTVGDAEEHPAELADIAPGATVDYTIEHTPHMPGEYPVSVTVAAGETIITTPETSLSVKPEEALVRHTAGTPDGSRSYRCPLSTSNLRSSSQAIYTAEELGLEHGDEILKVMISGYTITEKNAEYDVTLWLVNTTATAVDASSPRSTDGLPAAWHGKWSPFFGGTLEEPAEILSMDLTDGFIYTGDNLLVILEAKSEGFKSVYFISTASGKSIVRYGDTDEIYAETPWAAETGRASLNVYTAMQVPTVSGTVTDINSGEPISGARLSLTSGKVLYTAMTAADGTYAIAPVQHTLPFMLEIEADDYVPVDPVAVNFAGTDIRHDFRLLRNGETAITDIEADGAPEGAYYNLQGIRVSPDGLPAGVYLRSHNGRVTKVYVK